MDRKNMGMTLIVIIMMYMESLVVFGWNSSREKE
jgi:hypothetical protein